MPSTPPIPEQHAPLPQLPTNPLLQHPIPTPTLAKHLNGPQFPILGIYTITTSTTDIALPLSDKLTETAVALKVAVAILTRQWAVRVAREADGERVARGSGD